MGRYGIQKANKFENDKAKFVEYLFNILIDFIVEQKYPYYREEISEVDLSDAEIIKLVTKGNYQELPNKYRELDKQNKEESKVRIEKNKLLFEKARVYLSYYLFSNNNLIEIGAVREETSDKSDVRDLYEDLREFLWSGERFLDEIKCFINKFKSLSKDQFDFRDRYQLVKLLESIESLLKIYPISHGDNIHKHYLDALLSSLSFSWSGLSSGELALLNLFGRLYSLAEEVKDKESVLLLLDEVDLGLHPEWQRKWISTALPIIGEIFKDKHVQIIMTTHSPIMLSDIYQENVIFLGKDDNGERIVKENGELSATFGQNIHDLYRQSFFLGSTRGQYAMKTINHVIDSIYQLEYWQKEDDRKQEIYEELKWNDFREKILVPSGEDYDEEIVRPLLTIDDFDKYSGVCSNDDDDAKRAYEPLFKILYPKKKITSEEKQGNKAYAEDFEKRFDIVRVILRKIEKEDYQLETIEGLKDTIDEQYKNKKKENFNKIKEKSRKVLVNVSESKFSNHDFKNVLEKVINAIGERLIRNKLHSVFETIDFYLESEVPQSQAADVNELIKDLDDGQKRELLDKLRQELEEKDNQ